jgi:transcriptional regulator with XRE-family HTH domain
MTERTRIPGPTRGRTVPPVAPFHSGLIVAAARKALGWSRPRLARALGWEAQRLAAAEIGRVALAPADLDACVRALGLGSWALALTEEYFQSGGQIAGTAYGTGSGARWNAYVLGLEAGRLAQRVFRLLAGSPPGTQPEAAA